jgi:hypothetical protein
MDADRALREHLLALLRGGQAHMTFDQAVADFPLDHINRRPPHVPYTPWHLLEHLRRTQRDILDFIRDPHYQEPHWPEDYWPPHDQETDAGGWNETVVAFRADLQALEALTRDPGTDLYARIPHGSGQTILREVLLVADHNAYHIGEFAILRQVMQTWPAARADAGESGG